MYIIYDIDKHWMALFLLFQTENVFKRQHTSFEPWKENMKTFRQAVS